MAFNPIKPMLEGNQHKVNRNIDPNEDLCTPQKPKTGKRVPRNASLLSVRL